MLLTCALPLATVNSTISHAGKLHPTNIRKCSLLPCKSLVPPARVEEEAEDEEEEEGVAFQAFGFLSKGNEAGYVTHAAYHGHIRSSWNLSHWTTAGILTICCSSGNFVLLGEFTLVLQFHSISQAIEQPLPSAPAVLSLQSLLRAGTGTHLAHEQQGTRCHTSISLLLNWSSSTLCEVGSAASIGFVFTAFSRPSDDFLL